PGPDGDCVSGYGNQQRRAHCCKCRVRIIATVVVIAISAIDVPYVAREQPRVPPRRVTVGIGSD
ncbi:unnamed protein product, partial [marine sediment metagenome]